MPRPCTVCTHPELPAIQRALISRRPYCEIALTHGVGKESLRRHVANHLRPVLARLELLDVAGRG